MSITSSNSFSSDINDYVLLAEIGVGSFGRVYESLCKTNDTKCAVKKISKCPKHAPRGFRGHGMAPNINKIKTEVSIHSRLIHGNICQLYKVIEDETYVYLILELCSGGSLKDLIKHYNQIRLSDNGTNNSNGQDGNRNGNRYEKQSTPQLFRRTRSDSNLRDNNVNHGINGVNSRSSDIGRSSISRKNLIEPVISYDLIRVIMKQIISGLQYLHRNNIIHRDLNINNILFKHRCPQTESNGTRNGHGHNPTEKPEIKIVDLGLALDLNQVNFSPDHYINNVNEAAIGTTICGTPGFISPEVWKQSVPISPASDVFSLGSIIYSLISGVITPNGDINLDNFPPLATDLITRLLCENPSERLSLNEILSHPFMIGPINTQRLSPITKITKSLKLTLTNDGNVEITFFKSNVTLVCKNKCSSIMILHGSSNEEMSIDRTSTLQNLNFQTPRVKKKRFKPPEVYTLDSLPPNHWKKYVYASKFINLIRDKTPKVIYHCNQTRSTFSDNLTSVNAKVSSLDYKGNHYVINKVTLMENNTIFEASVLNVSNNSEFKVAFSPEVKEKYSEVLFQQMFDLYHECLSIESNMEQLSISSGNDYFPVTIGKRPKAEKDYSSPSSSSPPNRASSCAISTFSPSINLSTMSSSPSITSSPSLRSVQIKNIGVASQLSDGIEVR